MSKSPLAKVSMLLLLWIVTGFAFAQITVNVQNRSLREVLKEIEKVSDYKFFYNESLAGLEKNTTLRLTNSNIDNAMQQLLAGLNIEYRKSEDNIIVLVDKSVAARQQSARPAQSNQTPVKGRIVDATGEPVIGATIIEKGNPSNGTVTDYDGNFNLNVAAGAVLQISYIGFQEQEITQKIWLK